MTDEITAAQAIAHYKRTGCILPGHAATIARYRTEDSNA